MEEAMEIRKPKNLPRTMPRRLRMICLYCGKTIRTGPNGPDGRPSTGICDPCLEENHPEDLVEQIRERAIA